MSFRHTRPMVATLSALVLAATTLAPGIASAAPDAPDQSAAYRFQKVSFTGDPRFTQLLGINDHNVIAGYHGDMNTEQTPNKGFTLKLPANFSDENFPNSTQTQVIGINNSGDTDGFYIDQAGVTHGFIKSKDFTNVDLPGTTFNQLLGINNKDQAAGYFQDAAGLQHGYVHEKNGDFLVLNIPMLSSQATGINDEGTVVGFEQSSPAATTASGFILKNDKLTVLNYPGSTFTQALGINNQGEVVGDFTDANGVMHGFIDRNGHMSQIDAPGATSTTINGLNKDGRIVGFSMDANGNTTGLVGSPASHPTYDDERNDYDRQ
jgi:probable HAF family extracellular repeat protein